MSKKGLGRGLQALLPASLEQKGSRESIVEIAVGKIRANKHQPRHTFDEEKLNELASSIKEHGVIQPIIVRQTKEGNYELVAGERRFKACQRLGLKEVPAIIKDLTEKETSEIALIENIQREDLNPIEEAAAYKTLMEEYGLTQEELSKRVGKSRPFIANTVRLLSLPEVVKNMVVVGELSAGHARTILALPRIKDQEEVARKIATKGLSVRQTEGVVKDFLAAKTQKKNKKAPGDPELLDLEERLRKKFSTKVMIRHGKKSGRIEIEYYGPEEMQRLLEALLDEEL